VGLNRGALAARGRFAAVGASLVAENGLRLVAVCVLAGAGVQNAVAYGLCLVLGHLAALAWPGALRFADGPQSGAGSPFAFLAGAGFGQLVSQVVLTGGPVVLALSGGTAVQVTSLFAALALFRAPYLLAQGSVAPLTVRLTGWVIAGDRDALTRVRRGLLALAVVGVPLAAVVGWWSGPVLVPAVFGEDVELPAGVCAVVAAACAWAVVNLLLMIDVMAHGRAGRIASVWTAALLGAGAGYLALLPQGAMERSVGAFLVAEAVAWVALLTALPREETTAPVR
jgi:hypothetical protein